MPCIYMDAFIFAVGGFASAYYWSSTEYNTNGARDQTFANSEQNFRFKFGLNRVRAARTF